MVAKGNSRSSSTKRERPPNNILVSDPINFRRTRSEKSSRTKKSESSNSTPKTSSRSGGRNVLRDPPPAIPLRQSRSQQISLIRCRSKSKPRLEIPTTHQPIPLHTEATPHKPTTRPTLHMSAPRREQQRPAMPFLDIEELRNDLRGPSRTSTQEMNQFFLSNVTEREKVPSPTTKTPTKTRDRNSLLFKERRKVGNSKKGNASPSKASKVVPPERHSTKKASAIKVTPQEPPKRTIRRTLDTKERRERMQSEVREREIQKIRRSSRRGHRQEDDRQDEIRQKDTRQEEIRQKGSRQDESRQESLQDSRQGSRQGSRQESQHSSSSQPETNKAEMTVETVAVSNKIGKLSTGVLTQDNNAKKGPTRKVNSTTRSPLVMNGTFYDKCVHIDKSNSILAEDAIPQFQKVMPKAAAATATTTTKPNSSGVIGLFQDFFTGPAFCASTTSYPIAGTHTKNVEKHHPSMQTQRQNSGENQATLEEIVKATEFLNAKFERVSTMSKSEVERKEMGEMSTLLAKIREHAEQLHRTTPVTGLPTDTTSNGQHSATKEAKNPTTFVKRVDQSFFRMCNAIKKLHPGDAILLDVAPSYEDIVPSHE